MAFWGKKRWLKEGAKKEELKPIVPWQEDRVEAAGYRLSVGHEYYINGDGTSTVKQLDIGQAFVISPGEFAFILTREKVQVSNSTIGFISMRASSKFKGLVNVSGFQINPGFRGNLVFAVFNAGPRHINIHFGDEIFSVWYADLDEAATETSEEKGNIPNNLSSIPSEVINGIAGEALTAYQLSQKLSDLREEVTNTKTLLTRLIIVVSVIVPLLLLINRAEIVDLFVGEKKTEVVRDVEKALEPKGTSKK